MRKLIFPSVLVAFLCVLLSCNNIFTDDSSDKSSFGKALVSVSCGNGARTIMPTNLTEDDVTKLELTAQIKNALGVYEPYSFAGGESKEWASIALMNADSFEMDVGTYKFTLKVYAKSLAGEERVVQEAFLEDKLVTAGINTISFEAKYVSTGELSLKFHWDSIEKAGKTMSPISKLSINLYKINTDGSIGDPVLAESLDCRCAKVEEVGAGGTTSMYEAVFAPQEEIDNGSYFIIIKVCDIYEESKILNTITDIVKVKGYKTEKTINLDITKMNISNDEYTFYVAESGNDETGDGSAALPFASIAGAVSKMDNSSEIYSIVIIGTLTTAQTIPSTFTTSNARGLVILGLADDNADGLQGNYTSSTKGIMLSISSSVPVTIKNITISGGYSGQGSAGGIVLTSGAKLTMESGIITGNTGEDGGQAAAGGVMVKATATFIMNDGKICDNTGGGVCLYDGSNPGSEFIMNGGEISGNTASKGAGVHGVYSTANNAKFTMNGGKITGNIASSDGGGIYLCGQFTLTGGEISGNTAENLGNGIFVYYGTLSIKGSAIVADDNEVYLREGQNFIISGAIETDGVVATVQPQTYTKGTQILTLADGVDKSEIAKIALTQEEWALDDTGKLYVPYVLYVSGTGDDTTGDGSEENPYKTIAGACAKIAEDGKPTANWKIFVSGEITGASQSVPSTLTAENAKSLTITGATGLDADGVPQDVLDRGVNATTNGTTNGNVLIVSTAVPVTLTNLKITRGAANDGSAIKICEGSTVKLGDGILITKNHYQSNSRGTVHNEGTLFMYGSAVIGDKNANDFAYGSSSPSNIENGTNANYVTSGGGIFNGVYDSTTTVVAHLYLGYSGFEEDGVTLVKKELTGGIYKNGASSGGAIYNSYNSYAYIDSGNFEWNSVSGCGGAIYNEAGAYLEMTGGSVLNNRAYEGGNYTGYGGGIYNNGANSVFVMAGGVINKNLTQNDKGYGGGLYNKGKFFMYGTAVIGDKTADSPATATVWGNKSDKGGAIYNGEGFVYLGYKPDSSGTPVLEELTGGIYGNYATGISDGTGGGAINNYGGNDGGIFKIASGTIAYNASEKNGGAICHRQANYSEPEILGGTIKNNVAEENGGAVFIASTNKASLKLSANASIPAGADGKHDIYLTSDSKTWYPKITIAGALPDDFAVLLTPGVYDTSMTVLTLATDVTDTTLEVEHLKFSVTDEVNAGLGTTIEWCIDENGKLAGKNPLGTLTMTVEHNTNSDISVSGKYTSNGSNRTLMSNSQVPLGSTITFTATENYASYKWYVDGNDKNADGSFISTANTLVLDSSALKWNVGRYDVALEATDSEGKHYSYEAQIRIVQ